LLQGEKIDPALLAAMYLMALQWWTFDPSLSAKTRPDEMALRRFLDSILVQEMKCPKLVTIQALLLYQHTPSSGLATSLSSWQSTSLVGKSRRAS
jgi:hypothetical protein